MSENTQQGGGTTPLEQVKQQQAMQQESREVLNNRQDDRVQVPGGSEPSDRRKHPHRQMYDGGRH